MSKTIVTHTSPDLDAITSVWMVRRLWPDWGEAEIRFVPSGSTLLSKPPDESPDILHVDTGLGKFDHHQASDSTRCAAVLVYQEIVSQGFVKNQIRILALERISHVVLEVDHARDFLWPEPLNDRYEFFLEAIFDGMKQVLASDRGRNQKLVDFGEQALDAVLASMETKIGGEQELPAGVRFQSFWGEALGIESDNGEVATLAQRAGFVLVVKKTPKTGHLRVMARPDSQIDLTELHAKVTAVDAQADWYLHPSKKLLLNGSSKNPTMRPSRLALSEIIGMIQR